MMATFRKGFCKSGNQPFSRAAISRRHPAEAANLADFAILLFAFSLLLGCYEPKEGCLDINATNYAVDADDACPDCCTYPTLTISPLHQVLVKNTLDSFINFKYNTFYPAPSSDVDTFEVLRSRFFISNFKLVNTDGEEVGVADTIGIGFINGSRVVYEDNFAKLDRDIFSANVIGTTVTEGTFDKVKFTLGLPEALLQLDTASIPAGHPLYYRTDTLIYEEGIGYIPFLLSFKTDTSSLVEPTAVQFFQPTDILLPLEKPLLIKRGFNIKVRLRINYIAWFEGVDFSSDPVETIRQKMAANLPNAFSVTEITLE
ncbi:MAG: hypothetical protein H6577_14085 [Lewinellaceae bacterium]|nr:hypothetical protein [Lewinellaceae bacterium]